MPNQHCSSCCIEALRKCPGVKGFARLSFSSSLFNSDRPSVRPSVRRRTAAADGVQRRLISVQRAILFAGRCTPHLASKTMSWALESTGGRRRNLIVAGQRWRRGQLTRRIRNTSGTREEQLAGTIASWRYVRGNTGRRLMWLVRDDLA